MGTIPEVTRTCMYHVMLHVMHVSCYIVCNMCHITLHVLHVTQMCIT